MSRRRRKPGERVAAIVRGRVASRTAPLGEMLIDGGSFSIEAVPDTASLRVRRGNEVVDLSVGDLLTHALGAVYVDHDDDFGGPLIEALAQNSAGEIVDTGPERVLGNERFTVHVQTFEPTDSNWVHDESRDGSGCAECGAFAQVDEDSLCRECLTRIDAEGSPLHISVHTHNRDATIPWRILQRIKNEVAGESRWGCEWFPDEAHLVDEANERHIWVWPEGFYPPKWIGSTDGRMVADTDEATAVGAGQDPLPEWYPEAAQGAK